MLTQMPEYKRLTREQKNQLQERIMKVYVANHYPEEGAALDRVFREIEQELKAGKIERREGSG